MKYLLLSACLLFSKFSRSQNFPAYPLNMNLQVINTPHFKIIYPSNIKNDAQVVANLCEYVFPFQTKTLCLKNWQQFPLILSNQNMTSNAYVTLSIRKSEWYNLPTEVEMGATEWYQDLALHEMRHMVQFEKMKERKVTNGLLSMLFGELGKSFNLIFYPMWFYEGDAVIMETALSNSGRGRMPNFSMPYRAIILDSQKLKYANAVYRSFKNFYPNHYNLGYFFSAYLRQKYGKNIWDKLHQTSAWQKNIIALTNKNKEDLFDDFVQDFKHKTIQQIKNMDTTNYLNITSPKSQYDNYSYPIFINDSCLLMLHNSMRQANALVLKNLHTKKEQHLAFLPSIHPNVLSVSNTKKMVWVERQSDAFFLKKNYGIVVLFDIKNKTRTLLTNKTKYYNAIINHAGTEIAALIFDEERNCKLKFLNMDGTVKSVFQNLDTKKFISSLTFSNDDKELLVVQRTKNSEVELVVYDLYNENSENILKSKDFVFSNPIFSLDGKIIYYHSTQSGIDNIYSYDRNSKLHNAVTEDKIGADFPAQHPKTKALFYCHYTSNGFQIVEQVSTPKHMNVEVSKIKLPLPSTLKISLPTQSNMIEKELHLNTPIKQNLVLNENLVLANKPIEYANLLQQQEAGYSILDSFSKRKMQYYDHKNYAGIRHFRFHSWLPNLYGSPRNNMNFGITLYGNDLMNSLEVSPFIGSSINENNLITGVSIAYQKFFPSFIFNYTLLNRSIEKTFRISDTNIANVPLAWTQQFYQAGIMFPFNFSIGNNVNILSFSSQYLYQISTEYPTAFSLNNDKKIIVTERNSLYNHSLQHKIYFKHSNNAVTDADVLAKNSQDIAGIFRHALKGSMDNALYNQFSLLSQFVIHAFSQQDRFVFTFDAELRSQSNSYFTSAIKFPKGYDNLNYQRLYRTSFNYLTDFVALDFETPNWLQFATLFLIPKYSKALRANVFLNHGFMQFKGDNDEILQQNLSSVGIDILYQVCYISQNYLFPIRLTLGYSPNSTNAFFYSMGLGLSF